MMSKAESRFVKLNFIAIVVTLLLILAGGIVRSTGSGMGCPDWPKCFDQYIPPTSVSQLPANYQQKFVAERIKKNNRFADYLETFGKHTLADSIRKDQTILTPEVFNPAKTWTEYVNRLLGALTGVILVVIAIASFSYAKRAPRIVVLSVFNLFLVSYQGWLGSIVVSTNLAQWIVTLHMFLAVVIIAILVYVYHYTKYIDKEPSVIMAKLPWLKGFLFLSLAVSMVQIMLGTEVREQIDVVAKSLSFTGRNSWVSKVGEVFTQHRDLAALVLVINIVVYKMVIDRFNGKAEPLRMAKWMVGTLVLQIATGITLSYISLPPISQSLHVLVAVLLFCIQFYLYLLIYRTKTYKK